MFFCAQYIRVPPPSGWSKLVRQGSTATAAGSGDLNAETHAARRALAAWVTWVTRQSGPTTQPFGYIPMRCAVLGLKILREKAYVYDPTFPCPVVMHDGNKRR